LKGPQNLLRGWWETLNESGHLNVIIKMSSREKLFNCSTKIKLRTRLVAGLTITLSPTTLPLSEKYDEQNVSSAWSFVSNGGVWNGKKYIEGA